jgi:cytochrome c5
VNRAVVVLRAALAIALLAPWARAETPKPTPARPAAPTPASAAAPTPAPDSNIGAAVLPAAPARALVVRTCAACHAPEIVVAKRHTADEWDEIIAKMVDRGALATEDEQQQILSYLAKFFGPA